MLEKSERIEALQRRSVSKRESQEAREEAYSSRPLLVLILAIKCIVQLFG